MKQNPLWMQISTGSGKAKGSKTTRESSGSGGAKQKTSRSSSFDQSSGFHGGFKGTGRRASTTNIVDTDQLAKDGSSLKVDAKKASAAPAEGGPTKKKKAKKKRPAAAASRPRTARQ